MFFSNSEESVIDRMAQSTGVKPAFYQIDINGVPVSYEITFKGADDIATCYADTTKAKEMLGWEATHGLDDMYRDA